MEFTIIVNGEVRHVSKEILEQTDRRTVAVWAVAAGMVDAAFEPTTQIEELLSKELTTLIEELEDFLLTRDIAVALMLAETECKHECKHEGEHVGENDVKITRKRGRDSIPTPESASGSESVTSPESDGHPSLPTNILDVLTHDIDVLRNLCDIRGIKFKTTDNSAALIEKLSEC